MLNTIHFYVLKLAGSIADSTPPVWKGYSFEACDLDPRPVVLSSQIVCNERKIMGFLKNF